MARIILDDAMSDKLGAEMKMDVHWVDVKLKDDRVLKNLVVRNSRFITGYASDPEGIGALDFSSADIVDIRRTSWLPFW